MIFSGLQKLFNYTVRIGDATSQLLSVAFFFGDNPNESLSGRAYRQGRIQWPWVALKAVINIIFFWQEDHCREAYFADLKRARQLIIDHQGV